jgi:hypothetical protein
MEELPKTIEEMSHEQRELDKALKRSWYFVEKFGDEILKDEFLEELDIHTDTPRIMKAIAVLEKIDEIQLAKYPYPWYDYCCCSTNKGTDANFGGNENG